MSHLSTAELNDARRDWSAKRFLGLSKERGKKSWNVIWRRTGMPFGRIWIESDTAGGEFWQCQLNPGQACKDAYKSRQEALLGLLFLNIEVAAEREKARSK